MTDWHGMTFTPSHLHLGDCQICGHTLDAHRDGKVCPPIEAIRAQAYREGQERMRERCAKEADNGFDVVCCGCPHWDADVGPNGEPINIREECCGSPNREPWYPEQIAEKLRQLEPEDLDQ